MIDMTTEFGSRVARRLEKELVIWLTTLDSHLTPQPRPVWFVWDGESFLIYSEPGTHKLAHIQRHARVSLNLNSDEEGNDIVVFSGEARIAGHEPPADQVPAYVDKYREGIKGLDMTPEQFAGSFSVPLRVRPTSLRGY
jgi:PPOX class probable F420-dependent enzyme